MACAFKHSCRVMAITPAFAVACPTIGGVSWAIMPDTDATFMMTPPPRRTRCRHFELRHEEGNVEIASYGRPPVLDREVGHRTEVLDRRVVVDDVEPAVGGRGILNHLPRLFGVGEIDRRDASHLAAGATHELERLVVGSNLDVAPDNLCTFSRKGLRRDATQTSSRCR